MYLSQGSACKPRKTFLRENEMLFCNLPSAKKLSGKPRGSIFLFLKFSLNQPRLSPRTGISNSSNLGSLQSCGLLILSRKIVLSLSFSNQTEQILSVFIFLQRLSQFIDLLFSNIAHTIGDFLKVGYLDILQSLNSLDILRSLQETFMSSCIQPSKATAHELNREISTLQIGLVDISDFKLSTRTWFDILAISTTSLS